MRVLAFALAVCIVFCPLVSADEAPKDNAKKLIATWMMTKSEDLPPGAKMTLEFIAGGKLKMTFENADTKLNVETTYKIEGDKITITGKGMQQTETITIKALTDDKLIVEAKGGKKEEFKKVKK